MLNLILLGLGVLFILANLIYFFRQGRFKESKVHTGLLLKLFFTLTGITIGFAFLYYVLSFQETVLRINDPTDQAVDITFLESLYFSGVTILSVGYGDYVPVGSARFFALLQAALGLLIPSAFFLTVLGEKIQKKE
ncbi:ion channel [Alkalicoccus halolimnae]|uniref:Ion channel n=1 Tax=Alkalicoccus halolimnae TaxID=1667239 RepID=A0A5C7FE78_9BACI|nr:ion channel [Alkalicoccus halolimnae]TXF85607.1 two pore domain potassium channel family protein [Alkalicoccus halolimnae]